MEAFDDDATQSNGRRQKSIADLSDGYFSAQRSFHEHSSYTLRNSVKTLNHADSESTFGTEIEAQEERKQ
jgi:hypothetical protein